MIDVDSLLHAARLRLTLIAAALMSQRGRAVVVAAMVSLGIASTVVMMALGTGARLEMQALEERAGRNLFYVRSGLRPVPAGRGNGWYVTDLLRPEEAGVIEKYIPAVEHALPVQERNVVARLGSERVGTTVRGVTPLFFDLRRFEVESGRALSDEDRRQLRRVAVVGPFVTERLAGGRSLVGRTIRLDGVPFEVVGQLRAKGAGSDGSNEDDQVLVPFETAVRRLDNVESASLLLVQARSASRMGEAIDRVRVLLASLHHIAPGGREDFDVLRMLRQDQVRQLSTQWLMGLARTLAVLTITLGALGVLAVSVLNVKERVPEVGLRRALGATRSSIAVLFISESCVLSVLGAMMGIVIGAVFVRALENMTSWSAVVDVRSAFVSLGLSASIGVLCSLFPALGAARLAPARALVQLA